jgi:hypothetical protein
MAGLGNFYPASLRACVTESCTGAAPKRWPTTGTCWRGLRPSKRVLLVRAHSQCGFERDSREASWHPAGASFSGPPQEGAEMTVGSGLGSLLTAASSID